MGGKNEAVLDQPETKRAARGGPAAETTMITRGQTVRFHEGPDGKVHFHVDAEKLKVTVPVAVWYSAWNKIKTGSGGSWTWLDAENKTSLCVDATLVPSPQIGGSVCEASVRIEKIEFGAGFKALDAFTQAKT